jgi:cell division protein FtsW
MRAQSILRLVRPKSAEKSLPVNTRTESSPDRHFHFEAPSFTLFRPSPSWPKVEGSADSILTGVVIALVAFGVVMVYSSSAVFAYEKWGNGQYYLWRQTVYATAGLLSLLALAHIDYHRIRALTYPLLLVAVVLLFVTCTRLGHAAGGAARWIRIGPIHLQPSELAKLVLIIWLAYSLSKKAETIRSFSIGFLPHLLMAVFLMALCLKQPDFGSAVMIGVLTFVMLFAGGAKLAYILAAITAAVPVAFVLVMISPNRLSRFTAFWEPFKNRYGVGYQVAESLLSFGAGGMTGVGLGDSRQKLFFLPEAHTDFISAIIGEELGWFGIVFLVLGFVLIIWRGVRAAFRAPDDYGLYLAVGISMFIGIQAFTNLAVAEGILPTKGLVLPFVSYGGSSLLVNCAAVGVLLNISRTRQPISCREGSAEIEPKHRPGERLRLNARPGRTGGSR